MQEVELLQFTAQIVSTIPFPQSWRPDSIVGQTCCWFPPDGWLATHKSGGCHIKSRVALGLTTTVRLPPRCREGVGQTSKSSIILQPFHKLYILLSIFQLFDSMSNSSIMRFIGTDGRFEICMFVLHVCVARAFG